MGRKSFRPTINTGLCILDLLESGDNVMADRGFNIQDLLAPLGVTLNSSPFTVQDGNVCVVGTATNHYRDGEGVPKLPQPLLQRLTAEDNVEYFLAVFERVTNHQKWPEEV